MNQKNNPSKSELTISKNNSLTIKKSDLVRRGLELFYEIKNIKSDDIPTIQPRILFVDDCEAITMVYCAYFNNEGYETYTASRSEEALELLSNKSIDIVISDIIHPGMDGLELTKLIKERFDAEVILTTGWTDDFSYEEAINVGAFEFFYKPVKLVDVLNSVKKILKGRHITLQGSKHK